MQETKFSDVGLIGLAVMGQNLVLNMSDHHFSVSVFNRTFEKTQVFIEEKAVGRSIRGFKDLKEFFQSLKKPRIALLMVKAGEAVDRLIEQCLPFLEPGDILIDGGNSFYHDTERRCRDLEKRGLYFVGAGISGGEEGARFGPSIMPGGHRKAWDFVAPILQTIAAREEGIPCCNWIGEGGSGHFVKMVHNGIEYGDMQLICEAYDLLKRGLGYSLEEIQEIFTRWNGGPLKSYLIEITGKILGVKDASGKPALDSILDVAQQKGTGKWTSLEALNRDLPLNLIAESVFARFLSSFKEEREQASRCYPSETYIREKELSQIKDLEEALFASKIVSYAQGFLLMHRVAQQMGWELSFDSIALLWREGCIIRSQFLNDIAKAYRQDPKLDNLLLSPFFQKILTKAEKGWRRSLALGVMRGIPMPCFSAALAFFDGWRAPTLPANLLQAQRDFFGAHTYERVDHPRGQFFHRDWIGSGQEIPS
jgi:6-phosphogluconate dehydrogenase